MIASSGLGMRWTWQQTRCLTFRRARRIARLFDHGGVGCDVEDLAHEKRPIPRYRIDVDLQRTTISNETSDQLLIAPHDHHSAIGEPRRRFHKQHRWTPRVSSQKHRRYIEAFLATI